MTKPNLPRLIPTGQCWCGCGKDTAIGSFFARGHDKAAEAAILALEFDGSIAQLLHSKGYGPGRSLQDEAIEQGVWVKCDLCPAPAYAGTPTSVQNHKRKYHSPEK